MPYWIRISEACFFCIYRGYVLVWKSPSILEQNIMDNAMGLLFTILLIKDFFPSVWKLSYKKMAV